MDEESQHILSKQLLKIHIPQEHLERIRQVEQSPDYQQNRRELAQLTVKAMLEQRYWCAWANIFVKREMNFITIEWKLTGAPGDLGNYSVVGTIYELSLSPEVERLSPGLIVSTRGNGSVRLELEEGFAYHFRFSFMDVIEREKGKSARSSDLVQTVDFSAAVPLSDERKVIVRRTVKMDQDPGERVRHEFRTYLNKQDAFDEMRQEGIRRIKAKGLSSGEEQKQIADFEDYAESLKDKFGV